MQPYTALAAGYDVVMEHVAYDVWAEYVHGILMKHHPEPETLLELGCGTGSLALELQPLGRYQYVGTDGSPEMVRVAREKARLYGVPLQFEVADFTNFRVDTPVDVVVLLYDGLNYLLEPEDVRRLMQCTYRAVRPGGVFIFDQSTPANSANNEAFFEDQGSAEGFSYVRHSRYDAERRLHTTSFELTVAGQLFQEEHVQRAYDLGEVRALFGTTDFEELAAYDGFSTAPATDASERIHWVLRRPSKSPTDEVAGT